MSIALIRSAAGLALLAAVAAGCGTAAASHPASKQPKPAAAQNAHTDPPQNVPASPASPAATQPSAPAATQPAPPAATQPAPPAATHTANPIPQGNGGDQDADNNGGPSDGDGNI
jgi:uncharacterized membrane protein